jgi:pterin-4a-carbinolamine dehydratase
MPAQQLALVVSCNYKTMNTNDIPENKKSDFPKKFPIGPDPLGEEKLSRILGEELTEWKIIHSPLPEDPTSMKAELYREYLFEDFDKVIEYMAKVAVGCNILPHHPKWVNTWTTLRVYLTTWDITHIISYKDIMLARYMDRVYEEYANLADNVHTKGRTQKEKENFKKKIRELVMKDQLEEAFKNMDSYIALNPELNEKTDLIIIINRFTRYQVKKRTGGASSDELEREINKITADFLEILNSL